MPVSMAFAQSDGVTVGNTTAETTLFTSGSGTLTITAGTLSKGITYRLRLIGTLGAGVVVPTLHIRLYIGSVLLLDITVTLTAGSGRRWTLDAIFNARTDTSPSDVAGGGTFVHNPAAGTATVDADGDLVSIVTGQDNDIDVTAQWSIASANNTLTCELASIERMSV